MQISLSLVELIKINGNFVALLNIVTLTRNVRIYIYTNIQIHIKFIRILYIFSKESCMYLVYTNFNFHFLEDYFKRDEDVSTVSIRGIPTTMTTIFEILLFPDSSLSS